MRGFARESQLDVWYDRLNAAYADQNELDHRRLGEAAASGEVAAQTGV
jgi:hypothetical protein